MITVASSYCEYNQGISHRYSPVSHSRRLFPIIDPMLWTETHVRHWIQWAVKEFALDGVDIDNFSLNGRQLCDLKHEAFRQLIPFDRGDIFWTHLELLRKCKFVGE